MNFEQGISNIELTNNLGVENYVRDSIFEILITFNLHLTKNN